MLAYDVAFVKAGNLKKTKMDKFVYHVITNPTQQQAQVELKEMKPSA